MVDDCGNAYIAGYFKGGIDFDPGPSESYLTSAGDADIFVAKFSSTGAFIWANRYGGTETDKGFDLALADDGSLFVTGYFYDSMSFDSGLETIELISAGENDAFVIKLDAAGNFIWASSIGSEGAEAAHSIALSPDGNIHTTGYSSDANLPANESNTDIHIAKLAPNGNLLWETVIGGEDDDEGAAIATDDFGDIYVTGYFSETVDFDPGENIYNISSSDIQDSFVLKLNSNGDFVWAAGLDGNDVDIMNDIVVAADGSVYTTGTSYKVRIWGPFPTQQFFPVINDYFRDGLWAFGSTSVDYPLLVLSESESNDSGGISSSCNLTEEVNSLDLGEVSGSIVAKFDSTGNLSWCETTGSSDSEGSGLALGSDGNIHAVGILDGVTYRDIWANNNGFVSVLTPEGEFVRNFLAGSPNQLDEINIAVANDGAVYVSGFFFGSLDFDPSENVYTLSSTGSVDAFLCRYDALNGPADILLSESAVPEAQPAGTLIGDFSCDVAHAGVTYSYSLAEGEGADDNDLFAIVENQLTTAAVFDASEQLTCTIRVCATDSYGNSLEKVFTLSIGDIAAPTVTLDAPYITNDTTPSVTVTSTEGETVYLDVDLNNDGDFDDEGETGYTSATLVDGAATFDITPELADGTYNLRTRVSDAAGNEGMSEISSITIDTIAPTNIVLFPPICISDSTPEVIVEADGGVSVSLDVDLNNDGDFDDDGELAYTTATLTNGLVFFDVSPALADGTYNLRARVSDTAGNEGASDVLAMIVDTTAPDVSLTGPSFTSDNTPSITVTSTEGEIAYLDVDLNNDGDFDDEGENHYLTAMLVDGAATFDITPELADGTYNLQARVRDDASNEGVSELVTMTADTTAPTVTIDGPVGGITENNTVTYTISYEDANFDAGTMTAEDVELIATGTAAGTVSVAQGDGATRIVTISGISGQGTLAIAIASGTASDLAGNLAPAAGPSDPIAVGHRIDSVVVIEKDPLDQDGVLESNEELVITWAVRGFDDATNVELLIDGQPIQSVYGPYMSQDGAYLYAGIFGPLAGGDHTYTINSLDVSDDTATATGTFSVAAAAVAGPTVSQVCVVEAVAENGELESGEELVITWSATGESNIVSKSLKIDGQAATQTFGPYGTYYSGIFGPLDAGEHAYEITVIDANGADAVLTGTFDVAAAAVAGPTVSQVCVVEAALENGELESGEELVITWSATGESNIVSRSLKIDGQAATQTYGPYGTYYSGIFGPLDAGEHAYEITVIDANGADAVLTGTFDVAAAAISGPTVSQVCVVEATLDNGELESGEELVITWSATGESNIVSRSLKIDGQAATQTYGPYGTYYSGIFGPLDAGEHAYEITVIDANGADAVLTGTFDVAAAAISGPTVSQVCVVEATLDNGELESGEELVITWSATGESNIVSRSLKIDGQAVAQTFGPYGTYYSGIFGPLAAGEHAYEITVIDANGADAVLTGTFILVNGPTISSVVISEAILDDSTFESDEELLITWSATSNSDVVSASLTVDGQTIDEISEVSYKCYTGAFGPLSAGEHTYTVIVTDLDGKYATQTGTFDVVNRPIISSSIVEWYPEDTVFESGEELCIIWSAASDSDVVSTSFAVDGRTINGTFSSSSGSYWRAFGPLSAGEHTYVIDVVDASGALAVETGMLTVVDGPTISNIAISEAILDDYTFESDEDLHFCWSATSDSDIVSASLTVDSQTIFETSDTSAGSYVVGFGPLSAGEHTYVIGVVDINGAQTTETGTFTVAQASVSSSLSAVANSAAATRRAALLSAVLDEMSDILGHDQTADELADCLV